MIVPAVALLLVLAPVAVGARLSAFAAIRLRSVELAMAAFWVQLLGIQLLPGPHRLLVGLHVGSYVAAGLFVAANRRVPGLWLLGLGATSNGVAITLNGGTLPASAAALAAAGMSSSAPGFTNSGVLTRARLGFLGDVFAVPDRWPLSNVFSVGDVLIVLGCGVASWRICGTRWSPPWDARAAGHGRGRHLTGALAGVPSVDERPGPRRPQHDPAQRRPRPRARGAGRRARRGRVQQRLLGQFLRQLVRQLPDQRGRRFDGRRVRDVAVR